MDCICSRRQQDAHPAHGGDSFLRLEPPAIATMTSRIPACLRTSTCGRRSADKTNTLAHSMAVRRDIASLAPASPSPTTQSLEHKRCQPPERSAEIFSQKHPTQNQREQK